MVADLINGNVWSFTFTHWQLICHITWSKFLACMCIMCGVSVHVWVHTFHTTLIIVCLSNTFLSFTNLIGIDLIAIRVLVIRVLFFILSFILVGFCIPCYLAKYLLTRVHALLVANCNMRCLTQPPANSSSDIYRTSVFVFAQMDYKLLLPARFLHNNIIIKANNLSNFTDSATLCVHHQRIMTWHSTFLKLT